MQKSKLILFDIDGTLITSGGAGEHALRLALKERFGQEDDFSTIEIAGRTDSGIARQILQRYGLEQSPENITAFLDSYLQLLERELPQRNGRLLPGLLDLLKKLKAMPHVSLGLLTGNVARGAELKLMHYGVWEFFEFGAYGDDHHDRNELGAFACARAHEKHGVSFKCDDIFVIGDTPHDIACGKAFGAKTVAVATGNFNREQLAAHQPDYLFDDLSNPDGVIKELAL
jgi:phosphoglycolate phosphatase